jgi:hypothetical protein
LNEQAARVLGVSGEGILFEVPGGLSVGPAILRLEVGAWTLPPFVVAIDLAPPVIVAVARASGTPVSLAEPAVVGETLLLSVFRLDQPGVTAPAEPVTVSVGGVSHRPVNLRPSETDPSVHLVEIRLDEKVAAGELVPVTVRVGDRLSQPFLIPVRSP